MINLRIRTLWKKFGPRPFGLIAASEILDVPPGDLFIWLTNNPADLRYSIQPHGGGRYVIQPLTPVDDQTLRLAAEILRRPRMYLSELAKVCGHDDAIRALNFLASHRLVDLSVSGGSLVIRNRADD